jgi:hypothetical protein
MQFLEFSPSERLYFFNDLEVLQIEAMASLFDLVLSENEIAKLFKGYNEPTTTIYITNPWAFKYFEILDEYLIAQDKKWIALNSIKMQHILSMK